MLKAMPMAALLAGGLLALTGWVELTERARRPSADASQLARARPDETVDPGRLCSIYHARFGGARARLVRILRGDVANYVVIDVSRGSRVLPSVQRAWLRSAFGEGETVWLGEFASAETALNRAARLCPEETRCERGAPDCGPDERPFTLNVPRET